MVVKTQGTGPHTRNELLDAEEGQARVNGEMLYEVVDGQIVELPPMGAFESDISSLIHTYLNSYALQHRMGRAECEMMFLLNPANGRRRRPDVAFVSYGRWPRKKRVPFTEAWEVVPELAVEVVSPSNSAEEILIKVAEYFEAGCKRVWVVYPKQEQVYVFQSPTRNLILTRNDALDGEDFLPGFRLPLAELFEETEE